MRTFMKYKSVFVIVKLFFIFSVFAQKPETVQYISPVDGSELNSRASQIIIRQGNDIDCSSITPEIFTVIGENSGLHFGDVILSTDGKTIIFKPEKKFDPGEQVQIRINDGLKLQNGHVVPAFDFSFKITSLDKPLKATDYNIEPNLSSLPEELLCKSTQMLATSDSLPLDFPSFTLIVNDSTSPGDYYFSPTRTVSRDGYNVIVSNTGELKFYKKIDTGIPYDFKVASNGMLTYGVMYEPHEISTGGNTEFSMTDNSFNVVKQFRMGNGYTADYHEFQYLPNGHMLMLAYDLQPVDMSKLVEGGHPGALVAGSVIQELDIDGNVVFQWRSWDHYSLLDSYEDLTKSIFDAIHINSIELDLSDLNIIVSTVALAEATKINRKTGEIIWRMGGKNNEFTFVNESQDNAPLYFMFQHDIRRLRNGNLTMFDNGDAELRKYSRAVEYEIDEVAKTATKVWEYRKNPDIYSAFMGSVQRLSNGNTVIGWGLASSYPETPLITEVDADGNMVAELTFDGPIWNSYRAMKFELDSGKPAADITVYEVLVGNTYEFENEDQKTGIALKVIQHDGFGYNEIIIKRYEYGPLSPNFFKNVPVLEQARIVVDEYAIDKQSFVADIMFDVDFYGIKNPDSVVIYHREFEGQGLFVALPTQFNMAKNEIVSTMTKFGEFVIAYPDNISEVFTPLLVRPGDGQMVDQTKKVTLEWSPVGRTKSFSLDVATDAGFNHKIIEEQSLTSAVYDFETVQPNTEYFWRVSATNSAGESEWSQTSSFESTEPNVTILSPKAGAKKTIGLEYFIRWEDNLTEEVILELFENDAKIETIDTVASTGAYEWSVPLHMDVGDNYAIQIRSADNSDVSDESDLFSLVDYMVSVPKKEQTTSSLSFKNPSFENIQITYQIKQAGHVNLTLYNMQGTVVTILVDENQSANTYTVDFAGKELPGGIYLCTLQVDDNLIISRKMLIVK